MTLTPAFVALGANIGAPAAQVRSAVEALASIAETRLAAVSSLYRSAAVGYTDQPDFINAVAKVETTLPPRALLDALLAIERRFGRERAFQNAPRTLDLDLVLYDEIEVHEPGLTIPHPRMHERAFVMVPLAEIAPDQTVPGRGRVRELARSVDSASVTRIE